MKPRPKIVSRVTSLAHSFVHAIVPRHIDPERQAELYLISGLKADECAYCGASAYGEDHFRGLVKASRPSGHFHLTDNVVPACNRCNSSKGSSDWRGWMQGRAKNSPASRHIENIDERIKRLACFESQSTTPKISEQQMRDAVGAEIWDAYWERLRRIETDLRAADKESDLIRDRLASAFSPSTTHA